MSRGEAARIGRKAMRLLALPLTLSATTGEARPDRYAAGQVWAYETRRGDEGSLLKIQQVEIDPAFAKIGPIYHISVIGVHFGAHLTPELRHAPVSRATLDASVTRLSRSRATFPDPADGIAEWRRAKGGVFTITIAAIVDSIAMTVPGGAR